jgi:hypothetical protein
MSRPSPKAFCVLARSLDLTQAPLTQRKVAPPAGISGIGCGEPVSDGETALVERQDVSQGGTLLEVDTGNGEQVGQLGAIRAPADEPKMCACWKQNRRARSD